MVHTFTRQQLFDLVWSAPTRTVAKQLGLSDVGLAKACRHADLLLPPRGYWAKLAAGKRVHMPPLPPRAPGMSDRIVLGRNRWDWGPPPVDLTTLEPPEPNFAETLDELATRLRERIGTIRRTRDLQTAHPRVVKLLEFDEQRRTRQHTTPYATSDPPVFNTPFEQRRLRFVSSLCRALDRVGVTVAMEGREARTLTARVADYSVGFTVDAAGKHGRDTRLHCHVMALCGGAEPIASWADSDSQRIETQVIDIAIAIVVHGERVCRASAEHYRAYVIKRKEELVAEERRQEAERQRLERERLKRLEEARIGRLLAQARALQQAQEIRAYVAAVQTR